ncbi:unnamed protein product, partial [Rotaria magnacalcarata]
ATAVSTSTSIQFNQPISEHLLNKCINKLTVGSIRSLKIVPPPRRMNPSLGSDEFRSVPIGIRRSFSKGARKLSDYRRIPGSGIDIGS